MPIQTRPHIICHMMSTIDGKITSGDHNDILDNYFDLYTKTENLLPPHTAWMCGRVTMHMFASKKISPLPSLKQEIKPINFIAPHEEKCYMFGVDTKGQLRWDKNAIKLSNVDELLHLVIITTSSTPKEYLHYLQEKNISYIIAGVDEIDFQKLFSIMKNEFAVDTLLLEGGGLLNGSVMASNLIDEISLLLTPNVINQSEAPSLFERKQKDTSNLQSFTLKSVEKLKKDTLWLRYSK